MFKVNPVVPDPMVTLSTVPLTSVGKLDRKALRRRTAGGAPAT